MGPAFSLQRWLPLLLWREDPMRYSLGLAVFILISTPGSSLGQWIDLCPGNTYRCHALPPCVVDGITQPCAYWSSSVRSGSLMMCRLEFYIEWSLEDGPALVTDSESGKGTMATVTKEEDGTRLTLHDGDVESILIPNKWPEPGEAIEGPPGHCPAPSADLRDRPLDEPTRG